LSKALQKAVRQMKVMLPVLLGVILLVGLFQTFISEAWMSSVFTGQPLSDAFFGAILGRVLAGNPVNSYVIGKGLVDVKVGLAGSRVRSISIPSVAVDYDGAVTFAPLYLLHRSLPGHENALERRFRLATDFSPENLVLLIKLKCSKRP